MRHASCPLLAFALSCVTVSVGACDRRGSETSPTVAPEPAAEPAAPADDEAPAIVSEWNDGVITGLVTRGPKTNEPPAGSTLQVMLWGGTGDAKVVSQRTVELSGPAPWAFEITLEEADFDPLAGYGVSVMLSDPAGDLWFASKPVPVLKLGEARTPAEIKLDPMDPRAAQE